VLILHIQDVIELPIGQMIDTRGHERIKLDITSGFLWGGQPIHSARHQQGGRIGKRGSLRCGFRDSRDVWDVSRSWAAADRWVALVLTGSKRGVCHVSVNTPIMTSSHRPALKAPADASGH